MTKFKGALMPSFLNPPAPSYRRDRPLPLKHRALPPGKQWNPHCGKSARERTLRQEARKREKAAKRAGITEPKIGGATDALVVSE